MMRSLNLLPEDERQPTPAPGNGVVPSPLHQPEVTPFFTVKASQSKPVPPVPPPPSVPRPPAPPKAVTPAPPPAPVKPVAPASPLRPGSPAASAPATVQPSGPRLSSPPPASALRPSAPSVSSRPMITPPPLSGKWHEVANHARSVGPGALPPNVGVNLVPADILGSSRTSHHLLTLAGMITGTIVTIGILFLILVAIEIKAVSESAAVVAEAQQVTEQISALNAVRFEAKKIGSLAGAVKTMVDQHVVWTPLFRWLEKITAPAVRYSTMNGDAGGVVTLQAEAPTLEILLQQYRLFQQSAVVKQVELKEFTTALDQDGVMKAVAASFRLTLDPALFHHDYSQTGNITSPIKLKK